MIKLVVDVSLSPAWADVLMKHGQLFTGRRSAIRARRTARSWNGPARTSTSYSRTIWISAPCWPLTRAIGPSVIQVRAHDMLPEHLENVVVNAIQTYQSQLEEGAIVTVDELRAKVRVLPIGSPFRRSES